MSWFHKHIYKEIARTYTPPVHIEMRNHVMFPSDILDMRQQVIDAARGLTTILWECEDPACRALRKETMLGRAVDVGIVPMGREPETK